MTPLKSGSRISASNAMADSGADLRAFLTTEQGIAAISETHVDWESMELLQAPPIVAALIGTVVRPKVRAKLTRSAIRLLGKLQIDLEGATLASRLVEKYEVSGRLSEGSNSITLRATNRSVQRQVVLKILRPGDPQEQRKSIRALGALADIPRLIAPIDAEEFEATSVSGDPIRLFCIVFPFINAPTLSDFLRSSPPISPSFFEAYVRQVAGVLESLESLESSHGDLHGRNILVEREDPELEFAVIDPSHGIGAQSPFARPSTDFSNFQEHLADALSSFQQQLRTTSVQKQLGPQLFSVVSQILRAKSMTFGEVLRLLEKDVRYDRWVREREAFLAKRFQQPKSLGLLRWEEISDPAKAVELFEPFPELFRRVKVFGNSLVVGARGSGKSTYLAALAYFPNASTKLVDPNEIFGILFSCRQGEFKQFSPDFVSFDAEGAACVKHLLCIKIIRRLLSTLATSASYEEILPGDDLERLYNFANNHAANTLTIARTHTSYAGALSNLAAAMVRWEELELRRLFAGDTKARSAKQPLLDELALHTFCTLVRLTFPRLATSQFYFLFDDAGEPNIPIAAQRVLNELVASSNAVYCIKLSAERYSYDLRTSRMRSLEETHDFSSFDIATAYATDPGIDSNRASIRGYFEKIIARRLTHWSYRSDDITLYLGDQVRKDRDALPIKEIVSRLAAGRKDAYYSGWDVIWQLADRTPRSLIELVSEIFATAKLRPSDPLSSSSDDGPRAISNRVQDRAVRAVSNRRLRSLEFTAGELTIQGQQVPLGRHLYLCAASFGAVSHRYLTRYGKNPSRARLDERLAIERNDTAKLDSTATRILELLVRYGIFDDSTLNVAFDDGQKKPVYVFNRIFCPAFGISFRRDAHLRLSAGKLAQYLLEPSEFAGRGTHFLAESDSDLAPPSLFDEESRHE